MKRSLTTAFSLSASAFLVLGLAACGGSSTDAGSTSGGDMSSSAAPSDSMSSSAAPSDSMSSDAAMASGPVGPGCADYAAMVPSGAGSVSGMATAPVATAASNNPLLTTLVSAVSGKLNPNVNLVDTLNGGQFTVFAPVDDAFKKVDPATIETLKTDSALLQKVLTYHVVSGQLTPEQVIGMQTTVEGQKVDVTGTPDNLKVNGAQVICGGVKTANATVYLIDGVLTPPAS
ncbi:fasciclin domain-containing protein [Quadrisphaera setariae]|uniref:Fasciclin domain-containing protein n=1 Tax=Quadrisphaera setariae TaxID=2593304 RepID=A0A5C8Z0S0_9ACTN|nr:fasciclin domain-containing protein [Quadrisphaera setariae]TXR51742.1 fasciclin domain-containing protein [Quadrisphaera setariae]